MIGGVLSTNAGGNNTVRFGNARELMLGLEVVLPDGRLWDGLRALRKDNTGYALRHLFVGAEGTLGIVTGAVLKLVPRPRRDVLAFCAIRDPEAALAMFRRFRDADEGCVRAFGVHVGRQRGSGPAAHSRSDAAARSTGGPLRHHRPGLVARGRDAARARRGRRDRAQGGRGRRRGHRRNRRAAAGIWRLREETAQAQMCEGDAVRNDVSVPVSRVPDFLRDAEAACLRFLPGLRPIPFGHIGDGNVRMNLLAPPGMPREAFLARTAGLLRGQRGGQGYGRQLLGRTRRRAAEGGPAPGLEGRGRVRSDAESEAGARSRRKAEPWKGLRMIALVRAASGRPCRGRVRASRAAQ